MDLPHHAAYIQHVLARKQQIDTIVKNALARTNQDHEVRVIAVTKYIQDDKARLLPLAGITDCGENRWQVAKPKIEQNLPVAWHFIGPVQMNKAKKVAQHFDFVHSVDSKELIAALDRHAGAASRSLSVLLQVNISQEPQKSGVDPEKLLELAKYCLQQQHVQFIGLMMIGTRQDDVAKTRQEFQALRELRADLPQRLSLSKLELSMGMSNDFEVAVEEGASMIRIGRFLVLEENPRT